MNRSPAVIMIFLVTTALLAPPRLVAQTPMERGSENIDVISHIPLGAQFTVADIEMEQELSRPYVYVGRMFDQAGFDIIDIGDPEGAQVIYSWRIENPELHQGSGGMDGKHFKWKGRYYYVQSLQFEQGGPDQDMGAVVVDVTGLPDVKKVKEVGRIRESETPIGFHNIFIYKHTDGRVLLLTTVRGPYANVYDMGRFVEGDHEGARVARIPVPPSPEMAARQQMMAQHMQQMTPEQRRRMQEQMRAMEEMTPHERMEASHRIAAQMPTGVPMIRGYHDLYAAYDPATGQDKFYGGGAGGYYVYDISHLDEPKLVTSVTGVPGVRWGHTFVPTPDGRYAVGETEYQYAPLRIFDLKPGLEGKVPTITRPIGAWTADWRNLAHNFEIRWPFVFVSAYEDGLQVFNMQNPTDPTTVSYYDTYLGPHKVGMCSDRVCNGAFGVDVRNADGLIVISDMSSGFWAFRMEGFQGWNGHQWGVPNISSVQDWENGPEGAERSIARGAARETGSR